MVSKKSSHFIRGREFNNRNCCGHYDEVNGHYRSISKIKVCHMNSEIDSKTRFNDIAKNLTLKCYYILLLPFLFHGLSDDFSLVVFFIMFPKVVDDPEVDEQLHEDEAMANYLRSVSKSLVQDWIKFIYLKKSEMTIIEGL